MNCVVYFTLSAGYLFILFFQVRPLFDHLQKTCLKLYQPNAEVSVDERMVKSKARFLFKQYIKNKPTKWGFKLWCLCDSESGYTVNFMVYRGKEGETLSSNGLSYDVVMKLATPFLNQGYRIYMDNFYTSPQLLRIYTRKKLMPPERWLPIERVFLSKLKK